MIQAAQNKMIDPKALKPSADVADSNALVDLETVLEGEEFASELQASLTADVGEVKPIEVSADQLLQSPSKLLKGLPQSGNPEALGPKIFDPDLTRSVEKLIAPTTTEVAPVKLSDEQVLKLAKGDVAEVKAEITQAMLKTPQTTAGGRAPAIDLAQSEIDPQLMNMEDFVLQKNLAAKKAGASANAYGMNLKPQAQKDAAALELNATQTVNETAGVSGESVNSQQFILNMMGEQGTPKTTETQAPSRVFDMAQVKTENTNQIINQISDYIVQAKAAKEPTINLRVNHDDLGMIDITVSKGAPAPGVQDSVAVNIAAHSADGKNFFQQNSKELFSHLTQAGVNVSDLKLETPSQTAKNDFDMGGQSRQGQSGSERQFGSEQNQRRHDSDRRQELWNLLNDKEAA